MMRNRKLIKIGMIALLILGVSYYLYWGNNAIETTFYNYSNDAIPESFDGYTIVQVSDLHNKNFDEDLTTKIKAEEPDIIVITGDIIDRNNTDLAVAEAFLEEMNAVAPLYFVSGNHEVASGKYSELQEILDAHNVTNLDNADHLLTEDGDQINLLGLADPLTLLYEEVEEEGSAELVIQNELDRLMNESPTEFNLLLSHRAELMEIYKDSAIDLVFTGHAHGGQIRLPFIEGIYAPSQGFFPEYTWGEYIENESTMIVSRGLGNSIFPLRVFNRPELVVLTLDAD